MTDFMWGVATSAFQIEGALDADGRVPSIWDDFSGETGETGAVACDHYRRWREDLGLLTELGVNAYRFSIAWPRMHDPRGVAHYDRLIDGLLERGIEPVVTLYHWDLPAGLDWRDRDTVERFAEYAATCFDAYSDRVGWWVTINEPWIVGVLGYQLGIHAPGVRDLRASVEVMHNLLLAHARAARALDGRGRAGIAYSLFPHYAESPEDEDVARLSDGYVNRWFLDPVLKGSYPEDMRALYEERLGPLELEGETACGDFVGVNYYTRRVMRAAPGREPFPWEVVVPEGAETTDGGWEIVPEALTDLLLRLKADYGDVPVLITENGGIFEEPLHDERRIALLRGHVDAIRRAVEQGAPVRGYFHWSLLDNFEWAMGYGARFGLVHVDYETQARTVKDSGRAYRALIEEGL
ncbi:MAG: GH1 family beta-glucosidase [Gaiellaceae bacterium]